MKILLIRFSAIGDLILTTAPIRMLRQAYPEAEIDLVVREGLESLVAHNPHLTRIYTLPASAGLRDIFSLAEKLNANHYDWIFDWQKHTKSYLLSWLVKGKTRRMRKYALQRFFLVYFKKNYYRKIVPVPLRYLKALSVLKVPDDGKGLEFFVPAEEHQIILQKWPALGQPFWAFAPGGGRATKRWPSRYFVELIQLFGQEIKKQAVLVGGPEDVPVCDFIEKELERDVLNLCGKTSLLQTAAVLEKSSGLVANDTGVLHLASAFQKPVVALFGPTVKEFGFFPFRTPNVVLEKSLPCRPCSFHGTAKCPLQHFACMANILPQEVLEAIIHFEKVLFE